MRIEERLANLFFLELCKKPCSHPYVMTALRISRQSRLSAFYALFVFCVISLPAAALSVRGVVVDMAKRPIAGAEVIAVAARAEFQLPEDLTPLAAAHSDREGQFSLDLPTTGELVLIASAPGFRRTRFALLDLPKQYDKVGLALERGEKIQGYVFDEQGNPLADVGVGPVVLSPDEELALAKRHVPAWTKTDAQGRFTVEGLMPGRMFQFLVQKDGYELQNVSTKAGSTIRSITLKKGGSEIKGEVYSRTRQPAEFKNQRVWLNGNGFNVFQKCDDHGTFRFRGLPPGNFSLEALVEHPRISRVELLEFPRDNGKFVRVEVSEGYWLAGTTYDTTTSQPVGHVALRIEDLITTSDANGSFRVGPLWLVGKPTVNVLEECGFVASAPPVGALVAHTESDGFRDISGEIVWVRPIKKLTISVKGFEQTTRSLHVHFVPEEGSPLIERITTVPHSLRLKTDAGGVLWVTDDAEWTSELYCLDRSAIQRSREVTCQLLAGATLEGRVTQEKQTTAQRTLVRLIPACPTDQFPQGLPSLWEVPCRADGTFRIPNIPPGNYRVVAATMSKSIERSQNISLRSGQRLLCNFHLPEGKRFAGIVRDSKKQPLGGVAIRYYAHLSDGSTKAGLVESDPQGQFDTKELDADELSLVKVDHKGYAPWVKEHIVLPAENYEIVLSPEAALEFTVEAPPSTTWKVYLMRVDRWGSGTYSNQLLGREVAQTHVVGGARDAFPAPQAGRYRIVAANDNGSIGVSREVEWDPARGISSPVIIEPGKSGRIVADFSGTNVEDAEIVASNMIVPESLAASEHTLSHISGDSAVVDNLPAGDYLVIVTSESFSAHAVNVRIEPGETARVSLRPAKLGTIAGRVTSGNSPVSGITVTVKSQTDESAPTRTASTDESGSFQFDGLSPDLYVVEATASERNGGKTVRKSARIPDEGGVVSVDLDLTPPPRISFALPPSLGVASGSPVHLLSRESGEMIRPEWRGGILEANLSPGIYSVSIGDAPVGEIKINGDGTVELISNGSGGNSPSAP